MCPLVPGWGLLVAVVELAYASQAGFAAWAIAHAILAAGTLGLYRALGRPELVAVRAFTLAITLPVVGAAIAAVTSGRRISAPGKPEDPEGTPLLGPREAAPLPGRVRSVWELEYDLREGDLESRLGAVRALKAMDGADGVRALRTGLVSPDHQASLLASLALSELESEFEADLREGRRAAERDPRQAAPLAGLVIRYARSGLPAAGALPTLWAEARTLAERAIAADLPEIRPAAYHHLATAHLATGHPDRALDAAEAGLALAPLHAELALVRLEAFHALGETYQLKRAARELAGIARPGTHAHDIATFWSRHDTAHTPH